MRQQPVLNSSVFSLGCVLLALAVVVPDLAHAQIVDNIGTAYQEASKGWEESLSEIAKGLFIKLALIEVLWSAIWWVLQRDDPNQMMVDMLKKIMSLMFFWAILLNFNTWIPAVIDGFSSAGQAASNTGALTPGSVLNKGLEISAKVAAASEKAGLFEGGLGTTIISGLVALGVLLAFAVIAGQMLVTLVESYIVVSGGVLFLGFAGSRWTTTFAEKYLSYSVSVGVKLFVTYLIIGLGDKVTDGWVAKLTGNPGLAEYLEILGGAMIYMFLGWQIPALASSMLTGAVSMTLGSAAATVGTMAAGAAGAAGLAQSGLAGAGNGVAGAMQAGSAAIDQAKAGGGKGFLGVAGRAVGALGSAGIGAASDTIKGLGGGSTGGNLANRMANTTASLTERAAAGAPAASVPGSQPAAPGSSSSGSQPATPSAPPAPSSSSSGSQAATRSAPQAPGSSPSGSQAATPSAPPAPGSSSPGPQAATPSAPPAPSGSSSASQSPGSSAVPSTPQSSVIDTSGNISQALADRDSGAGGAGGAGGGASGQASSTKNDSLPMDKAIQADSERIEKATATGGDPIAAADKSVSAVKNPGGQSGQAVGGQPSAPQGEQKNALQQLSEHASALGKMPNDSAPGAGVQINLKHD
ncbi:type IV secretion system protein TrbL [Massilia sp. MP_M2]|uniref:P-type conjugative transfer protein TrbL n=1 Tax=Massilia sp. MP_M2 TaxID=3071713 RepID=UPI00319E72AE